MSNIDLQMLVKLDSSENFEFPDSFDCSKAEEMILGVDKLFKDLIGSILGDVVQETTVFDSEVQDATFFAELSCFSAKLGTESSNAAVVRPLIQIRFSNFGWLYTVVSTLSDSELRGEDYSMFLENLQSRGFVLIDTDLLDLKYEGRFKEQLGDSTWWNRYFEYS